MKTFRSSLCLLGAERRAFLAINAFYFGLVLCAMVFAAFHREVQQSVLGLAKAGVNAGPLGPVVGSYQAGRLIRAAALTWAVNFIAGSLLVITVPSLVVPFSGMLTGAVRAVTWGLIFSPSLAQVSGPGILHGALTGLLILLEGEGYVLAMMASYVQGRAFLFPARVGARSYAEGYRVGLKQTFQIYVLVAAVLAIAAIYEASLVILIQPTLK